MADLPTKVARMLLWFEAHLSEWLIEAYEQLPATLVEGDPPLSVCGDQRRIQIQGYGKCVRCSKRFTIPRSGNAVTFDESRIEKVAAGMKEWARRDAEQDGPCWGDVPQLLDNQQPAAVLDAFRADD